jgi:hypothetical protein
MDLAYIRSVTCGALLIFGTSMANAEEFANLGELLDKGAKRLDAAELKALLTGATISGNPYKGPTTFELTFVADGNATGRIYGLRVDASPAMAGTWLVNEQGQICTQLVANAFGGLKSCSSYYSLNNVYYAAQSDERTAIVRMRTIKR